MSNRAWVVLFLLGIKHIAWLYISLYICVTKHHVCIYLFCPSLLPLSCVCLWLRAEKEEETQRQENIYEYQQVENYRYQRKLHCWAGRIGVDTRGT